MSTSYLTKCALAASLAELLREHPLDRITIKDITDHCGMTRNTFYYHFQDIYDLCSWIFTAQAQEIISKNMDKGTMMDGLLEGINYLYSNKKMVYHVFKSVQRESLEIYLKKVSEEYALEIVERCSTELDVSEKAKEIVAEFYKNAFVGKLFQWIEDGMRQSPDSLALQCDCLFNGTVRQALLSVDGM